MPVDAHRRAEQRSLAYHREIATRLTEDPSLLRKARARVADWIRSGAVHPTYATLWRDLLNRSPAEIPSLLCADDETATAMRQVSPFAGALTPKERWRIWRSAGERAEPPGRP